MALINLGWILFRANSLLEARQMLSAIQSPASYGTHFLSGSRYFLVASLAVRILLFLIDAFDRDSDEAQAGEGSSGPGIIGFLARVGSGSRLFMHWGCFSCCL
jgi:hypothetical protein